MRRRFVTLDVFTQKRFAGNPLAVVLDADGLDDGAMQAIAREFNLSETVFVRPAAAAGHRARLKIFTPARELPFAGHPTVGTAVLLARLDGAASCDLVVEENVGPVRCHVVSSDAGGFARFDLPRMPERVGPAPEANALAAALGLAPDDIGSGDFAPAIWSAGNAFTFVPVRARAQVASSRPDIGRWTDVFGTTGAFVFCRETVAPENAFYARMYGHGLGIHEDPATGSAVAAFSGMVAPTLRDGAHDLGIEQGFDMGRPSLIRLAVTVREQRLANAAIGGDAVMVSEGTIEA